ncbi:SURF1 family protein [Vibrio nigripulchritudo]|uniref:SURF1 family protein n=1 Tax=Vibrio nigripulchritudo TaxID=28173 RepID=UPI00056E2375|nr:SURF1 family protein [Vibrio nigripulchritudo]
MLTSWVALTLKPKFWFALILTLVVFTVLIKLGFWQLGRGEQKLDYEKALADRATMTPITLDELNTQILKQPASLEYNVTGTRVTAEVQPTSDKLILLDNQIWNGKVGYLALQPAKVLSGYETSGKMVLIELGFVETGSDRRVLPYVETLTSVNATRVEGRVYQRQINPVSDQLYAEVGWPKRIQNLNLTELESELGLPLLPFVIQPSNLDIRLEQPWRPVPLSSQKHFGYSLQWFSMAAVFALIMTMILLKALGVRLLPKGENDDSTKPE